MIIILGGIPTSGKTSIVRSILGQLGSYEECEPLPLFACQKYGDILVVGKYKTGEKIKTPEKKTIHFKMSKKLFQKINADE